MKRLPNVNDVVKQVFARVDEIRSAETVKVAEEAAPSFTIPVAEEMHKLAALVRSAKPERVTVADVKSFASQLSELA